ncbi:hypothetical protein QUB68_00375 [Microcoleus sp. A006_D1]|uniref:hypothetical protein n=1 Tax=Microcoleus sp. A006_D1 TaxID=3055267 RepID=UPI002FD51915
MNFWGRETVRCGVRLCGVVGGYIRLCDRAIDLSGNGRFWGKCAIGRSGDRAIRQIHDSVRLILPVTRN